MFFSVVLSVIIRVISTEVTGWRERIELEVLQRKYFKWILGLNRNTRSSIVTDECQIFPIRVAMGERAMRFEEKAENSPNEIIRECVRGVRKDRKDQVHNFWWKRLTATHNRL